MENTKAMVDHPATIEHSNNDLFQVDCHIFMMSDAGQTNLLCIISDFDRFEHGEHLFPPIMSLAMTLESDTHTDTH